MTVVSTWREDWRDAEVYDVGGFARIVLHDDEAREVPAHDWPRFILERLAPLVWLSMPGHEQASTSSRC